MKKLMSVVLVIVQSLGMPTASASSNGLALPSKKLPIRIPVTLPLAGAGRQHPALDWGAVRNLRPGRDARVLLADGARVEIVVLGATASTLYGVDSRAARSTGSAEAIARAGDYLSQLLSGGSYVAGDRRVTLTAVLDKGVQVADVRAIPRSDIRAVLGGLEWSKVQKIAPGRVVRVRLEAGDSLEGFLLATPDTTLYAAVPFADPPPKSFPKALAAARDSTAQLLAGDVVARDGLQISLDGVFDGERKLASVRALARDEIRSVNNYKETRAETSRRTINNILVVGLVLVGTFVGLALICRGGRCGGD